MALNRTKATKNNLIVSVITNVFIILFQFITRTVLVYIMGNEYVGLSGLFSSILEVLNMADLGLSSAVLFYMYGYIVDNKTDEINAILRELKIFYTKVGLAILTAGSMVTPFLNYLIKDNPPSDINVYFIYLLYLLDIAVGYFVFPEQQTVLIANQRVDLVKAIHLIVNSIKLALQVLFIVAFRNYYLFAVASIMSNVVGNLITKLVSRRLYSDYQPKGKIDDELKTDLYKRTKGLFIGNVSNVTRNSFDSIIISSFIGIGAVGIYNNYFLIFSGLYTFINYIPYAMRPSVGNSIAVENVEKNYKDLRKFQLIYGLLVGICSCCMIALYQPFMRLWLGEKYLMSNVAAYSLGLYFYLAMICGVVNLYLSGFGLWDKLNKMYLVEAVSNLLLNIILCKRYGVEGVIFATIITLLFLRVIPMVVVTFKYYFKVDRSGFAVFMIRDFVVFLVMTVISLKIVSMVSVNSIGRFIICGLLVSLAYVIAEMVLFGRTEEAKSLAKLAKRLCGRE